MVFLAAHNKDRNKEAHRGGGGGEIHRLLHRRLQPGFHFKDGFLLQQEQNRGKEPHQARGLEGLNIRKNVKEEIILLAGSDENMQKAIIQGKEYKKDVTFGFLELLGITRNDRKRQRYKPLIENLGKLGITLDIISEEKAQAA